MQLLLRGSRRGRRSTASSSFIQGQQNVRSTPVVATKKHVAVDPSSASFSSWARMASSSSARCSALPSSSTITMGARRSYSSSSSSSSSYEDNASSIHEVSPCAYPNNVLKTSSSGDAVVMSVGQFREAFSSIPQQQEDKGQQQQRVVLRGRIWGKRVSGSKLMFADLRGGLHGMWSDDEAHLPAAFGPQTVQLCAAIKRFIPWNQHPSVTSTTATTSVFGAEQHDSATVPADDFEHSVLRLVAGDLVEVIGTPGRTKVGELTLFVESLRLLAPIAQALPREHFGIRDAEKRYERRHVDMLFNPVLQRSLLMRSVVLRSLRGFLDRRGFVEVETPVLSSSVGGAAAIPFKTEPATFSHQPLLMRIAPELSLKQLVAGGIERCYEIGKVFRNEGVSPKHNPEFTSCEFYCAYQTYEGLMEWTEDFFHELLSTVYKVDVRGDELYANLSPHAPVPGRIVKNDAGDLTVTGTHLPGGSLTIPRRFNRIDFVGGIEQHVGSGVVMNLLREYQSDPVTARAQLMNVCRQYKVRVHKGDSFPKMLDRMFETFIEPDCSLPTFIINHPCVLSPLARPHDANPLLSQRFELIVNGQELCNAYSELNDPQRQRASFHDQARLRADEGDLEAQIPDEKFCRVLEDALPPTAGWGLGIDRVVMLLSGATTIRDAIAFPLLKEHTPGSEKEHTTSSE